MVPTMTIEVRIPNVPLFNGQASKVVDEEMRDAMNRSVDHLKGQILPLVPEGVTGALRKGVLTSITGQATSLVGRVFEAMPYGIPVEYGTPPHPVSRTGQESIALWVRRKLGITDEREARSVAFLIARKIRRQGSKGHFFFTRAWEANRDRVLGFFEQANARIVARLAGKG